MDLRETLLRAWDPVENRLKRMVGDAAYRGAVVTCPCCSSSFKAFAPRGGQPNRICWRCGAAERHRALWLYLSENHDALFSPSMRVLHIAPEKPLQPLFQQVPGVEYIAGDFERRFGSERIDVTDLQFEDATVDAILCNHVLEHVPDDRRAMAEIRRVLKPGGWAILLLPAIRRDETYEDATIITRAGRREAFGQTDHVRVIGWDYLNRFGDAGLSIEALQPDELWSAADVARFGLRAPDGADPIIVGRRFGL